MGFFNFIETFFFISLAITFILIIMLVYHFKDRLSILEGKTNTIMDILNNTVKELIIIKNRSFSAPIPEPPPPPPPPSIQNMSPFSFLNPSMMTSMFGMNPNINPKIMVSDDEDSDSTDDDDYDEDSDEEQEGQVEEENKINIDNDDIDDIIEIEEIPQTYEINDFPEPTLENIEVIDTIESIESINESSPNIPSVESYKSMDMTSLKSLVLEKGLATDVKKMKKNELIKLLSDNVQ
jgi:hypothetical protein